MIADYYFRDGGDRFKKNYLILTALDNVNNYCIDKVHEQYIRRDYIVDKIYDRKNMLNK